MHGFRRGRFDDVELCTDRSVIDQRARSRGVAVGDVGARVIPWRPPRELHEGFQTVADLALDLREVGRAELDVESSLADLSNATASRRCASPQKRVPILLLASDPNACREPLRAIGEIDDVIALICSVPEGICRSQRASGGGTGWLRPNREAATVVRAL